MKLSLNPEFITENGKPCFAVLPYKEFVAIQEALADYQDLLDLRQAKRREARKPTRSLAEVKRILAR